MAGISSKGMYGLAAMYELMRTGSETPVQIREIAERANIPQNYLEQLLVLLRRNGLVKSTRGAHGGYMLAKAPGEITVFEILDALEGGICLSSCKTGNPVLKLFWEESQRKVQELFSISLADLEKYQQQLYQQMIYNI